MVDGLRPKANLGYQKAKQLKIDLPATVKSTLRQEFLQAETLD